MKHRRIIYYIFPEIQAEITSDSKFDFPVSIIAMDPLVGITFDSGGKLFLMGLTPHQARAFAACLFKAADKLEGFTAEDAEGAEEIQVPEGWISKAEFAAANGGAADLKTGESGGDGKAARQ